MLSLIKCQLIFFPFRPKFVCQECLLVGIFSFIDRLFPFPFPVGGITIKQDSYMAMDRRIGAL